MLVALWSQVPGPISNMVLCSPTATTAETGGLALAVSGVKVHEGAMHRCTPGQGGGKHLPFASSLKPKLAQEQHVLISGWG